MHEGIHAPAEFSFGGGLDEGIFFRRQAVERIQQLVYLPIQRVRVLGADSCFYVAGRCLSANENVGIIPEDMDGFTAHV